MSETEVIKRLRNYGADIEEIKDRFCGNMELYSKCLELFSADGYMEQLDNAVKNGTCEDTFSIAHTIKGLAGNLGLKEYYTKICDFVELLRANDLEGAKKAYATVFVESEALRRVLAE